MGMGDADVDGVDAVDDVDDSTCPLRKTAVGDSIGGAHSVTCFVKRPVRTTLPWMTPSAS